MAIVVPVLGMVATRTGWITFQIGFLCLALGLVFGSIAFFSALVGHVIVAAKGLGPTTDRPSRLHLRLAGGGLMGLAVSIFVVLLFMNALRYPSIYDISTDVNDPPVFIAAIELRGVDSNPLVYNEKIAQVQQASYPDVKPYVHESLTVNDAFELVRDLAVELNWEIVTDDPENTVLEAVATTFWYGFKDDIVVRIRQHANNRGSTIDIRSASRVGVSDVGTNARRIREFLRLVEQRANDRDG
ncbi:MAG: DUF1499 domain-containing protein [Gammaproteobacteria bacterium]|nr:DUF1499 domain-containing protein [Gammaproteobacteria bacterium]